MIDQFQINKHVGKNGPYNTEYYTLQLSNDKYYAGDNPDGVIFVTDEGFAGRFGKEEHAKEMISHIVKLYDENGKKK